MKIGTWIIAGTPLEDPYPCRCHESRYGTCSAAWCPCAGQPRPRPMGCCGNRYGPADHVQAMATWRILKLQREA